MKAFAVLLWLFSSVSAWSGNEAGGGNAVVCRGARGVETVRLLDYHESEVLTPKLKIYHGPGKTPLEKVGYVLKRLTRLDSKRAISYEKKASTFFDESQFVTKLLLPDLNDYGYVPPLGENCKIEQLAVQRMQVPPEAKRYLIKGELWDKLSEEDRAGLILHELVYGEAMKMGHKNSINSRYYNSLISSVNLEEVEQADYDRRMTAIGFSTGEVAPPHWVMNPLIAPAATENVAYRFLISKFAHSPSDKPLTFSMKKGPAWLSMSADGQITGTPSAADIGSNLFLVAVSDGVLTAEAVLKITVVKQEQHTPVWQSSPLELGFQQEDSAWKFDLKTQVKDVDGTSLTFRATGLPSWMALSSAGILYGTPHKQDAGKYSGIELTAINVYGASASIKALGEVIHVNHPPQWAAPVLMFPNVVADKAFLVDLNEWTVNPSQMPLKFTMTGGPSWLSLSSTGQLAGTPSKKDIGTTTFTLALSSGEYGAIARVQMTVGQENHAPYWLQDPIVLEAKPLMMFSASIAAQVSDIDGDVLTFSKVSGPDWLRVTGSGNLAGIPSVGSLGENIFVVKVSDGTQSTPVTLKVIVKPK